ncbi:MAG: adenylate/guanylate cyclase domain-containing protein [Pseudomonadota bacterium]
MTRWTGFVVLVLFLALRVIDPPLMQTIRLRGLDIFQQMWPRDYSKKPIVIIDIDEASLEAEGQWPWSRAKIARLIDAVRMRGGIAIGFDILFAEEDRLSPKLVASDNDNLPDEVKKVLKDLPDNEAIMANAMRQFRVVLARSGLRTGEGGLESLDGKRQTPNVTLGDDPRPWIQQFGGLVANLDVLEEAAAGFGLISLRGDVDGVIRRAPVVMGALGALHPAFAVELLRVATGKDAYAIKTNEAGVTSLVVAGVEVPTDQNGQIWPYFTKSEPTRFVSAGALLKGEVPPQAIAGRLVLVGTSAVGLQDLRATPLDARMPGVEVHAQIMESILGKHYLVRPNYAIGAELVATLVISIIMIVLVPIAGALRALSVGALIAAAVAGTAVYMFLAHGFLFDAVFPLIVSLSLFLILVSFSYLNEERERRRIRGAFSQYLAPPLVAQLAKDPSRLVLGGETREISVLFTDVRGFTSISEAMKDDPQGLTTLINRLLTPLSNAIVERQGTIDKYMGDAIMAFWNAPLDDEDNAANACAAALKMIAEVEELNAAFQAEAEAAGRDPREISIGIGINTGISVVGNMGTHMRFDYTALGDTVNLAARLEGQSKTYGVPIIVGETTATAAADTIAAIEIDLIQVKGKQEPERIFAVLGDATLDRDENFKALKALNRSMIASYRTQDWASAQDAVAMCSELAEKAGQDLEDYLFLYETRIAEFKANPPGADWSGVYEATMK